MYQIKASSVVTKFSKISSDTVLEYLYNRLDDFETERAIAESICRVPQGKLKNLMKGDYK